MSNIRVRDNRAESRFEAQVDGELAGFAEYRLTEDTIVFTHTEVDSAFEGRGIGSTLIKTALDQVRVEGTRTVVPVCPFVAAWLQRHPDYTNLTT